MVAVIYGSSTLNTEYVSQRLVAAFGSDHADLHNVKDIEPSLIEDRSGLVFVTSTWGTGDLQDDWELFLPRMEELSFEKKVVGLVGVGDQDNYPETFCDSIAILYELVTRNGGRLSARRTRRGIHSRSREPFGKAVSWGSSSMKTIRLTTRTSEFETG
jgi:flavodoxin